MEYESVKSNQQITPRNKRAQIRHSLTTLIKHLWKPTLITLTLAGVAYGGFETGRFYQANMPLEQDIGHQNTTSRAYHINGQMFIEQTQDTKIMVTPEVTDYSKLSR